MVSDHSSLQFLSSWGAYAMGLFRIPIKQEISKLILMRAGDLVFFTIFNIPFILRSNVVLTELKNLNILTLHASCEYLFFLHQKLVAGM